MKKPVKTSNTPPEQFADETRFRAAMNTVCDAQPDGWKAVERKLSAAAPVTPVKTVWWSRNGWPMKAALGACAALLLLCGGIRLLQPDGLAVKAPEAQSGEALQDETAAEEEKADGTPGADGAGTTAAVSGTVAPGVVTDAHGNAIDSGGVVDGDSGNVLAGQATWNLSTRTTVSTAAAADSLHSSVQQETILPATGTGLAGVRWSDLPQGRWDTFRQLIDRSPLYQRYLSGWGMRLTGRVQVEIRNYDAKPLENATVQLYAEGGTLLWAARTTKNGTCYLYYGNTDPALIKVSAGGSHTSTPFVGDVSTVSLQMEASAAKSNALDMLVLLETSPYQKQELAFFQDNLKGLVAAAQRMQSGLTVRTAFDLYQGDGGDYLVQTLPFSTDTASIATAMQTASVGADRDYTPVLTQALGDAVNGHDWSESGTKILFLVTEQMPAYDAANATKLQAVLTDAAAAGIRIVPIVGGNADMDTELILRAMAAATGGDYVLVTDGTAGATAAGSLAAAPMKTLLTNLIADYLNG